MVKTFKMIVFYPSLHAIKPEFSYLLVYIVVVALRHAKTNCRYNAKLLKATKCYEL